MLCTLCGQKCDKIFRAKFCSKPCYDTDLVGKTFGTNKVISTAVNTTYGRKWKVSCINCGHERSLTPERITNKCLHCMGMAKGESGLNRLFFSYKRNAGYRSFKFDLSLDDFRALTCGSCKYCGALPNTARYRLQTKSDWGDYTYNGIDRIDNTEGYHPKNCVSCCSICNRAKSDLSYPDFVAFLNRIKSLPLAT